MGYNTEYMGILEFNKELTASQLSLINEILDSDFRDLSQEVQKALVTGETYLTYINLVLTKNFSGVEWNGTEKSHSMVDAVNAVTNWMRIHGGIKDFSFVGTMHCQGEDVDDKWDLIIEDGIAKRVQAPPKGIKIECPHCEEYFYYNSPMGGEDSTMKKKNLKVCLTGNMELMRMTRKETIKVLEERGHTVVSTVGTDVDYLIKGKSKSKESSKIKKAKELGVEVISEEDFWLEEDLWFKKGV